MTTKTLMKALEKLIYRKLDEDLLMHWNPKVDNPKPDRGNNPLSAHQGVMFMVVGMPI